MPVCAAQHNNTCITGWMCSDCVNSASLYTVPGMHKCPLVPPLPPTGNSVRLFSTRRRDKRRLAGAPLDLPKIRRNALIEILPINSGCLNHCTYCKTKHARGDLASYPPEEIVQRTEQAFSGEVTTCLLH